jgi:thermospermine synthase
MFEENRQDVVVVDFLCLCFLLRLTHPLSLRVSGSPKNRTDRIESRCLAFMRKRLFLFLLLNDRPEATDQECQEPHQSHNSTPSVGILLKRLSNKKIETQDFSYMKIPTITNLFAITNSNFIRKASEMPSTENTIVDQRAKAGFYFREDIAPGLVLEMPLKRILHSSKSEFQQIDVIDSYFGITLVTDGKTQSAEFDEFAYHETLVHPAILTYINRTGNAPKTVFIGGGGELATAREVLRHSGVERVIMVDLDGVVVDVCVEFLPQWGGEAVKSDPRFELTIGDAYAYLLDTKDTFDVVIMDISDPIEAGPGIMLYTKELYHHVASRMPPNGVFVTQAGIADAVPPPHADAGDKDTTCFGPITNTLREVFDVVMPFTQSIPSFGSDWGFVMAFTPPGGESRESNILSVELVDSLIEKNIKGGEGAMKMYDGITHQRMFHLTKAVRRQLATDKRVMTKDNPVFMY